MVDAPANWEIISYRDSAISYGTDKPDLRNPIKMQNVSEHFRNSGFAIFSNILEKMEQKSERFRTGWGISKVL